MQKEVLATSFAPSAIGPYSQGIVSGNLVFLSGQIPLNPKTGKLVEGGIEEQAIQVLNNIKAVLAQAAVGMDHVVKTTCFLADLADFEAFNKVYATYFGENPPARSCVAVAGLPKGARLEVEVIASK